MNLIKVNSLDKSKTIDSEKINESIIKRLMIICKEDKNSPIPSNKYIQLEKLQKELLIKNQKLSELLEKASKMDKEITEDITSTELRNLKTKESLLELLGSES